MDNAVKGDFVCSRPPQPGIADVFMAGRLLHNRGIPRNRPRDLGAYGFVFIDSGTGYFEAEGFPRRTVQGGDLLVLLPGQRHSYGNPTSGWQELFAVVNSPHLTLWERSGIINRNDLVWHLEPVNYWRDSFLRIINSIHDASISDSLLPLTELLHWVGEARDYHHRQLHKITPQNQWALRARREIASMPPGPPDWNAVARTCGTSVETFRKRFRNIVGKSPNCYRTELQMTEAVRILSSTDLSIKEIAFQLGYCDPFHFSKRFKQFTNLSPTEFRNLYFPNPNTPPATPTSL